MTTETLDIRIREDGAVVVRRNIESIGPAAQKSQTSVDFLKRTLASLGGALAVRELLRFADTMTGLENRLRSTGLEGVALTAIYKELLAVSNQTRSSVEGSVELYSRLSLSSKELGVSQSQLLDFTKSLNQAIILSGASGAEAQAGLIQFSQGLASGVLRGDELRSVLEQLPAVADVIAKGLGVTRGELRKLGEEGKITAQSVLKSFADARIELDQRFAKTVPTLAQSFTVLKNNAIDFIGRLDKATGTTEFLSRAILGLANNLDTVVKAVAAFAAGFLVIRGAQAVIAGTTRAVIALNAAVAANPIAALAIALISAVTAIVLFSDKIDTGLDGVTRLSDLLQAFGETARTVFTAVVSFLEPLFGPAIAYVKELFGSVNFSLVGIMRAVASAVDFFVGAWRGAVRATVVIMEGLLPALGDIFVRAINSVLTTIGNLASGIGRVLNKITDAAGLGKVFEEDIKVALVPNKYEGAAAALGKDISSAFAEGMKESTGVRDFIETQITRAQEIARDRARKAMFDKPDLPGTTAGPPARIPVDAKEVDKARNALRGLLGQIMPSAAAALEMARAQGILNNALSMGLINGSQYARYLELVQRYYEDQIDPLGAINREMSEQISLLGLAAAEREDEAQLLQIVKKLRSEGIDLDQDEIDGLRGRIRYLRELNEAVKAQDALLQDSVGVRQAFVVQLDAMQKLLNDANSGFTRGDAATEIMKVSPDLFAGTQTAIDAQIEAFSRMYETVEGLRQRDLISEETASLARQRIAIMEGELRMQNAKSIFDNLAVLSQSGNRKIAAIGKAAAITSATIDGVLAVQKALASAPPPYNYALATAVGIAAAANVAKIAGIGFEQGGFTGNGARNQPAGIVHGQEFVVNADATARNRSMLESMNAGRDVVQQGAQVMQTTQVIIKIINVLDESLVNDYMSSERGGQTVVNHIRANSTEVKTIIAEA